MAVSFDVLESRWPHHWSFQVFMVNALETLGLSESVAAGEAALSFRTGATATVPVDADSVEVVGYDGPTRLSGRVRRGRASLPAFARVGIYEADQSEAVAPPYDRLVVNLLDPTESDVRPVDALDIGGGAVAAAGASGTVRKEVWPWFAWGALGLLVVEWVVYTGRMRV